MDTYIVVKGETQKLFEFFTILQGGRGGGVSRQGNMLIGFQIDTSPKITA